MWLWWWCVHGMQLLLLFRFLLWLFVMAATSLTCVWHCPWVSLVWSLPPQVFAVSCGRSFTTCVTMDGELFAWGINVHGECGIGAGAAKGAVAMAA